MGMLNPFPHAPLKELELRIASFETETHDWKSEVRTFPQECLLLAQGFGPDAAMIATEIAETALLAYKIQRRKQFYWEFRERLVSQIITITARKLMRLPISTATRYGSLAILAFSDRTWWFGAVGESVLVILRENEPHMEKNVGPASTQLLGQTKQITPFLTSGESRVGDWYCLQTRGVISEAALKSTVDTISPATNPTALVTGLKDLMSRESVQNAAVAVVYKTFM